MVTDKEDIVASEPSLLYGWLLIILICTTIPISLLGNKILVSLIVVTIVVSLGQSIFEKVFKRNLIWPKVLSILYFGVIGVTASLTGGILSPYIPLMLIPIIAYGTSRYVRSGVSRFLIPGLAVITGATVVLLELTIQPIIVSQDRSAAILIMTLIIAASIVLKSQSAKVSVSSSDLTETTSTPEQSQMLALINSMAEAFLAIDESRRIVLHNPAASRILHKDNIVGKELKDVLPVTNSLKEIVDLGRLINNKSTEIIERNDLILVHDDNSSVILDFSISPVKSDLVKSGTASAITHIIVVRDVTERKNLEEQREEFLSVISHELRTPIATAEADLSVLLNPKMAQLNERSLHYATVAHDQVVFLSEILNDITSLSRLEKDSFRTKPEPFNAVQFTEALRDEYNPIIAEKNLLFRCVINENLPVVITNSNEVKEILSNLLNNSVKYTKEGTITLSVEGSYKSRAGILFTVQDNGIGIAKTDLEHVFEKFYRSEDYRTRESGGTGLGLYLCARLAERMKASLWVESELSRGSRFYLFIPQQSDKPPSISEFLSS